MGADTPELAIHPAATVVLVRDGDAGLEVLMLQRRRELAFYGGAWVFPGGRVDADDARAAGASDPESVARIAAVRETREEAGLTLTPGALTPFARWVTPPMRTRRFDTWFFAHPCPSDDIQIDRGEIQAHRFYRPADALGARDAGHIELAPPTFVTLSTLATHRTAAEAFDALTASAVAEFTPRPIEVPGGSVHLYEGDAGYEGRDPSAVGPRHRITAVGDRWRYEAP